MDLEQVLFLPSLTRSQMFCSRQLSCYDLGVRFGDINKGHVFSRHEGMSGRGGNEIASRVFEALNSNRTVKRILTVWSDTVVLAKIKTRCCYKQLIVHATPSNPFFVA